MDKKEILVGYCFRDGVKCYKVVKSLKVFVTKFYQVEFFCATFWRIEKSKCRKTEQELLAMVNSSETMTAEEYQEIADKFDILVGMINTVDDGKAKEQRPI